MAYTYAAIVLVCLATFIALPADAQVDNVKVQLDALLSKLDGAAREQVDRLGLSLIDSWGRSPRYLKSYKPRDIDILVDSLRMADYEYDEMFTKKMYDAEMRALVEAVKTNQQEVKQLLELAQWKPWPIKAKPSKGMETVEMRLTVISLVLSVVDGSFYEPDEISLQAEAILNDIFPDVAKNKQSAASLGKEKILERVVDYLKKRYLKERKQESGKLEKEDAVYQLVHRPCKENWLRYEAEELFQDVGLRNADVRTKVRVENLRTICDVVNRSYWYNIWREISSKTPTPHVQA